ncbi:hypothetical protein PN466_00815 [Roseofilum reptotaenium CS-1145]|uniref:Uncharacterized protein n=1 Tax=Roseofilum reptotaenium AO1-A TaxID=1925591 RepID=A0A1L9QKN8_9CYAN|nr:hypothetical protein [Roseofilum reptotaenium]MDB9515503.1 hypothetical protein [Roseofilum reptotaenium CS-1145]OJJ16940.1 hypothetical protein BI308_23275 [Roseofilum reptotaenium AO1-A]
MKKIEVSDEIYETLMRTGDGDANFGFVLFWETGAIVTKMAGEAGILSPSAIEEITCQVALRTLYRELD